MELNWVKQIPNVPLVKRYAQFCEENIFDHIFDHIETTNKYLVDFGAGGLGSSMSNSRYLLEKGWTGLRMDGNPGEETGIAKEFITAENICSLFRKHGVPYHFDLLSVDIDGNDFWVLKNILEGDGEFLPYSPRVIIHEFNGTIPHDVSISIKNNPGHTWGENDYYGASFDAFKKLLTEKEYTLVHQVSTTNMIWVRSDIVPQHDYGVTYTPQQYHAHSPNRDWVQI